MPWGRNGEYVSTSARLLEKDDAICDSFDLLHVYDPEQACYVDEVPEEAQAIANLFSHRS